MVGENERILVADGGEVLSMARLQLHGEGFEVAEAADCATLLHLTGTWRPHVILLDVEMPTLEGWPCLKRLHELDRDDVTVIAILSKEEDEERALELGARCALVKPFGPVSLLHAIRDVLGKGPLQVGFPPSSV